MGGVREMRVASTNPSRGGVNGMSNMRGEGDRWEGWWRRTSDGPTWAASCCRVVCCLVSSFCKMINEWMLCGFIWALFVLMAVICLKSVQCFSLHKPQTRLVLYVIKSDFRRNLGVYTY